jgi:hypothetical protein
MNADLEALLHPGCQLAPLGSLQILFSYDLLQDLLIQREVGNDALQACVLILELPQLAQLAHFSDRGRLFQADRGRRFSAIVDASGVRASEGFNVAQSSTISLKR